LCFQANRAAAQEEGHGRAEGEERAEGGTIFAGNPDPEKVQEVRGRQVRHRLHRQVGQRRDD
jgi:hypothetical protein